MTRTTLAADRQTAEWQRMRQAGGRRGALFGTISQEFRSMPGSDPMSDFELVDLPRHAGIDRDLGPLLDFPRDDLAHLFGRPDVDHGAHGGHLFPHLG